MTDIVSRLKNSILLQKGKLMYFFPQSCFFTLFLLILPSFDASMIPCQRAQAPEDFKDFLKLQNTGRTLKVLVMAKKWKITKTMGSLTQNEGCGCIVLDL